ncbi:hypothetical protein ABT061_28345 [Streptosporangium sp. NPDC002544]|uniref:hypothetical protein n=1 Tax=Streptosporangium sp. NPDC002544 TaxID=3154538 RepID=UPI0033288E88
MEHFDGSDYPTVYHGMVSWRGETGGGGGGLSWQSDSTLGREEVRALAGGLPRVFALVREAEGEGEGEEIMARLVAYGLALPGGDAATVGTPRGFGRWTSARSAAYRLGSDLVWLGDG